MPWLSAFAAAAGRYWLGVFPAVNHELNVWQRRARAIPDPQLRRLASDALRRERGNLEGAAAFAAFLPSAQRRSVVRASVAFQAAYDYVDALSEQPSADPAANARCLHAVLPAALGASRSGADYYSHRRDGGCACGDGGYLEALRDACWSVVRALPAYACVSEAARSAALRIQAYQSLNLSEPQGGRRALARWAKRSSPCGSQLRWWETAASAGSSMLVFALISAAAAPATSAGQVDALTLAYFPWIGALHTLLDSLIDEREDDATGHRSLLDYYGSPCEAAQRMAAIAAESVRRTQTLDDGLRHRMILAAMASFYLSAVPSGSPYAALVGGSVLRAMGELARPTMLVMGARRRIARLRPRRGGARPRAAPPRRCAPLTPRPTRARRARRASRAFP